MKNLELVSTILEESNRILWKFHLTLIFESTNIPMGKDLDALEYPISLICIFHFPFAVQTKS